MTTYKSEEAEFFQLREIKRKFINEWSKTEKIVEELQSEIRKMKREREDFIEKAARDFETIEMLINEQEVAEKRIRRLTKENEKLRKKQKTEIEKVRELTETNEKMVSDEYRVKTKCDQLEAQMNDLGKQMTTIAATVARTTKVPIATECVKAVAAATDDRSAHSIHVADFAADQTPPKLDKTNDRPPKTSAVNTTDTDVNRKKAEKIPDLRNKHVRISVSHCARHAVFFTFFSVSLILKKPCFFFCFKVLFQYFSLAFN